MYSYNLFFYKNLGKKVKEKKTKDCAMLCDRFRQIAILLEVMSLQNEIESKKGNKENRDKNVELVEKTLQEVKKYFCLLCNLN